MKIITEQERKEKLRKIKEKLERDRQALKENAEQANEVFTKGLVIQKDLVIDTKSFWNNYYEERASDYDKKYLLKNGGEQYYSKIIKIKGSAILKDVDNVNFPNLRIVEKNANFSYSRIKALPTLEQVDGTLDSSSSKIESFPELEKVGGDMNLRFSPVRQLPKLKEVGGDFIIGNTMELKEVPNLKIIHGSFKTDGHDSALEKLDNLQRVEKDAYFGGTNIMSLPDLEYVGRNLGGGGIQSMPKLEVVDGNASFTGPGISNLNSLRLVNGTLDLMWTEIERLPSLTTVNGGLWLQHNKDIKELPELTKANEITCEFVSIPLMPKLVECAGGIEIYQGIKDWKRCSFSLSDFRKYEDLIRGFKTYEQLEKFSKMSEAQKELKLKTYNAKNKVKEILGLERN